MATRIAISDAVAAGICFDAGLQVEQTRAVLLNTTQPTAGYYYSQDINNSIKEVRKCSLNLR